MKHVQITLSMDDARKLHLSLETLDALTNTAEHVFGGKFAQDLKSIRPPFVDLREALDTIMHAEAKK